MPRMKGTSTNASGPRRRGGTGLTAGIGVLALLLAAGCKTTPPIQERPVGLLSKSEVMTRLNTQAELTKTVRAKLAVKVQTSGMRSPESCDGSLAAECPDRLRIRGWSDLLGYPPFDIGSDGTTWFVQIHTPENNEIHIGLVQLLDESFDPGVPLSPRDIVLALGVGRLDESPIAHELFFTRNPGYYLITEIVTNTSGRYVAKRIFVDATSVLITRMETYRPDGGIDMIADMTYETKASTAKTVPVSARIRLLRKEALLLDLTLKEREAGVALPAKVFTVPSTEDVPHVYRHDSR